MRSVEVLQSMQIAKLGPIKLAPALTTQWNHDCDVDDDSMYSFRIPIEIIAAQE